MEKLGTKYGGWLLPKNTDLSENSIVYSIGVGEDISFDLQLVDKYNCNIWLVDPTPRSVIHFNEYTAYSNTRAFSFSGNIQNDYEENISKLNHKKIVNKLKYINIGVWNEKANLKFYKQSNSNYVSRSFIKNMFTDDYDIVKVDTLRNLMKQNNHTKIDLLKMDIEGAEIVVLNNMIENNIFPKYLCVEFDLKLKSKDFNNSTEKTIKELIKCGYNVLCNDNLNITFEKI